MHRRIAKTAAFSEVSGFAVWAPKFATKTTSLPPRGRTWAFPTLSLRRGRTKRVSDPGPGGLHSLRVRPGRRYRLPESALRAAVAALERDLLLGLENGGAILLRDLFSVEVMRTPPVFELGDQDLPAQMLAALGMAHGGGVSLGDLIARAGGRRAAGEAGLTPVLDTLRRDGLLPPAAPAEWDLP